MLKTTIASISTFGQAHCRVRSTCIGKTARKTGLVTRAQNDAKALTELDAKRREYDFTLFGLSAL